VVDLYLRAETSFRIPVKRIRPADIEVWEDGERIDPSKVTIEPLQKTDRGLAVVLAIDASGTMRGGSFQRAKEAALALLERRRPQDHVAVVSFAEDVQVVADFDLSSAETRLAVRNLEMDLERSQHTLLYDGAFRAIELMRRRADLPRRAFMILLSDGKDGGSDRSRDDVIRAAKGEGGEAHILIFSIGYTRFGAGGIEEMRRLAEGTGGDLLEADSMVHARDFFDASATRIQGSYVLRFPTSLDGEEHEVRITIEGQSSSREAFYPHIRGPIWPYLIVIAGALAALGIFLLLQRAGTAGRIRIASGPGAGSVVPIKAGKTRIGALEDNDVVLPLSTVSRYHAEILARGSRVEIRDLRSKNGTLVNGQVIRTSPLVPGDKVHIADVELVYER
jgi:VWFA-related protein